MHAWLMHVREISVCVYSELKRVDRVGRPLDVQFCHFTFWWSDVALVRSIFVICWEQCSVLFTLVISEFSHY